MTSTSINVGLGEGGRNTSKVLKPPGGGSSDIFGASDPVPNSPRRVPRAQTQTQSSLFSEQQAEAPARNKPGNDSHNRLFGPVDPRPPSANNHLKSNIILNSEEGNPEKKSSNTNSSVKSEADSRDGNPVTGEGYSAVNGDDSSAQTTSNNPAPATNGTARSAPPQRNRVPPGGYSSGLW